MVNDHLICINRQVSIKKMKRSIIYLNANELRNFLICQESASRKLISLIGEMDRNVKLLLERNFLFCEPTFKQCIFI